MNRIHRHHQANRRSCGRVLGVLAAVALALVVGTSSTALAQAQESFRGFQERHGRVQREVERTQELWVEVSSRAVKSNLPGVRELVEQARTIQGRAKDALTDAQSTDIDSGPMAERMADRHLQTSLTLTLRARDLTVRAARQLREDLSQEETARRLIERVRQQLERGDAANDDRRTAQARELLDRAETQWRDGRFEQALRLAQNANAILDSRRDRNDESLDPQQVAASLERVRARFEKVQEHSEDRRRLGVVQRLIDQAQNALDAGRTREAAQRVLAARRGLDDFGNSGGDAGASSRTERALGQLDRQIERIQSQLGDRLDESEERLLRQAGQSRDRARRALQSGDESQAQQHIRAAADLLARLRREVGRG